MERTNWLKLVILYTYKFLNLENCNFILSCRPLLNVHLDLYWSFVSIHMYTTTVAHRQIVICMYIITTCIQKMIFNNAYHHLLLLVISDMNDLIAATAVVLSWSKYCCRAGLLAPTHLPTLTPLTSAAMTSQIWWLDLVLIYFYLPTKSEKLPNIKVKLKYMVQWEIIFFIWIKNLCILYICQFFHWDCY